MRKRFRSSNFWSLGKSMSQICPKSRIVQKQEGTGMKLAKRLSIVGMAIAGTIGLAGPHAEAAQTCAKPKYVIGMSLMTLTNPYFETMAKTAAKDAAADCAKLIYYGGNMSEAQQLNQVEAFIQRHVNAIMFAPADAAAASSAVLAANHAHIPVFTIDTNVDMKTLKRAGGHIVEFVQSNNVQLGENAAKEVIAYDKSALHGAPVKLGWIDYPFATSVQDRDKGFKKIIDGDKNIHVVSRLNGKGTTPGGLSATAAMLSAHPDVNVIFDINAPSGLGAMDAIRAANKVGKVAVIGLSGSQQAVQAICQNSVYKAGALQSPAVESKIEVANIIKYLDGDKNIPKLVLTKTYTVSKANCHEMMKIAYP
ncbi:MULTISPECIES: substrate-binding domain-containing protein [unclassified Acidiphilium]|uniref:substrate-binding domain-containing protein n=1 Tax=unclassified Acidiphilium TaxID=2617493 RepID=UPI0002145828|nr:MULTISPECIES: substrate-binding domain-containing protein [unclassified Acidiphilium]EGO96216.1 Periplasmic binding protein/LacI transcriptional regulator [Acidiphilium sp. PM]